MFYRSNTLIELLVVISIILILATATLGLSSLNTTRASLKMEQAEKELASAIKLAQTYALQGKTQNGATPCGYGVHFDSQQTYKIFYRTLVSPNTDCDQQNSADSQYRIYSTENDIYSASMSSNGISVKDSPVTDRDVFFTVPYAEIYSRSVNNTSLLIKDKVIQIQLTNGKYPKNVTVSATGLVMVGQ